MLVFNSLFIINSKIKFEVCYYCDINRLVLVNLLLYYHSSYSSQNFTAFYRNDAETLCLHCCRNCWLKRWSDKMFSARTNLKNIIDSIIFSWIADKKIGLFKFYFKINNPVFGARRRSRIFQIIKSSFFYILGQWTQKFDDHISIWTPSRLGH